MSDSILTVTEAADSTDLTVLATVKRDLSLSGTDDDAFLSDLIRRASQAIAAYCNRVFAEETVTETFRDICQQEIALKRYPNIVISSIVLDGTTLTTDDYEVDDKAGMLYRLVGDSRCHWRACKLVITYTAGYALLDGLPFEIEDACLRLIKSAWMNRDRDPSRRVDDVPGVQRYEYWVGGTNFPQDVADLLGPHKNPAVQ